MEKEDRFTLYHMICQRVGEAERNESTSSPRWCNVDYGSCYFPVAGGGSENFGSR